MLGRFSASSAATAPARRPRCEPSWACSNRGPAAFFSTPSTSPHCPRTKCRDSGIAYVPQGRRLFAELTVRENLEIGLMARKTGKAALDRVLVRLPGSRRAAPPARRHALRRRAADAGDGARALHRAARDAARRADRGADAVDDRAHPRERAATSSARASRPSWSSSASTRCCRSPIAWRFSRRVACARSSMSPSFATIPRCSTATSG